MLHLEHTILGTWNTGGLVGRKPPTSHKPKNRTDTASAARGRRGRWHERANRIAAHLSPFPSPRPRNPSLASASPTSQIPPGHDGTTPSAAPDREARVARSRGSSPVAGRRPSSRSRRGTYLPCRVHSCFTARSPYLFNYFKNDKCNFFFLLR